MKHWQIKTLGDLFDITSSKRVFESDWKTDGVPFYRAREIVVLAKQGYVDNELFISEKMYQQYSKKYDIPKEGDIMVTGVGTLGISYIVKKKDRFYFKDGNIIWLRKKSATNSRFVQYAFQTNYLRNQIDDGQGATVGTYTIIKAKRTRIPVPPLLEQERIVKLLDEADGLRKLRAQADQCTAVLISALFHEMFGNKVTNSKGWPIRPLGELVECLDSQRVPVTESDRTPGPIPYYGANGQVGCIDKHLFDEPLLLVAEDGGFFDQPNRGVAYTIIGKSWVNNHAHVLRPKKNLMELSFLEGHYRHYNFMPYVSGATRAKLNKKQLLSIPTLVPPLSLQKEFAKKTTEIRGLEAAQSQSRQRLDALFQSMLHRAFNGEL